MSDIAIGVGYGNFYDGLPDPPEIFRFMDRADELGIDSIWMPDHVISANQEIDPSLLMAVIAARTSDIKMGPSVLSLPGRNPIEVANTYANLDYLTGGRGRVIMAVGLGSDPRLAGTMGFEPRERAGLIREAVEILRALWTRDEVTYQGEYYQFEDVSVNPKPSNGPLDIWIGGNSEYALRRVAEFGDGWLPSVITPESFESKLSALMGYCEEAGRVVERDEAGVMLRAHVDSDPTRAEQIRDQYLANSSRSVDVETFAACSAFGTPEDCIETIEGYIDAGCTKFVLLPVGPIDERVSQIETYYHDVITEL